MRKMTSTQIYHYLLSFDDDILIWWHNHYMIDPYDETSLYSIRLNTKESRDEIKDSIPFDTLFDLVSSNPIDLDKKYIAIVNDARGVPSILCFNTFEEYLDSNDDYTLFLWEQPDFLEGLEEKQE